MPVTYDPTAWTDAQIEAWIAAGGEAYDDPYAYPSHSNRIVSASELTLHEAVTLRNEERNKGTSQRNYLYNPSGEICQRGGVSGSVAMADDTYQADDRWYSLVQGANATIQRQTAFSGLSARYVMRLVAGGTTNRYGRAQILEAADTVPLRGKSVVFKLSAKAVKNAGSGTIVLRYAICEWTSTADSVTSDIVLSWTSSTYTANNFFLASNLNILNVGSTTLTHGTAADCTLTATVGASANNLIVFYWTQDVPAHASDYIEIGETGLFRSSYYQRIWTPRPLQQELALCQRYCEVFNAASTSDGLCTVHAYSTTGSYIHWVWRVEKRAAPVVTYSSVGDFIIRQVNSAFNVGAFNALSRNIFGANDYTSGDSAYTSGQIGRLEFDSATGQVIIDSEL